MYSLLPIPLTSASHASVLQRASDPEETDLLAFGIVCIHLPAFPAMAFMHRTSIETTLTTDFPASHCHAPSWHRQPVRSLAAASSRQTRVGLRRSNRPREIHCDCRPISSIQLSTADWTLGRRAYAPSDGQRNLQSFVDQCYRNTRQDMNMACDVTVYLMSWLGMFEMASAD